MALTIVPSANLFTRNVGTQAYVSGSGSTGSKCLCCPYGYHIDLDFVRYCEAVAAESTGDRSSSERRRKRERRRQCQSMEVLLGLVSPALGGIEAELPEISRESSSVERSRRNTEKDVDRDAEGDDQIDGEGFCSTVPRSSSDRYRNRPRHRPTKQRKDDENQEISPGLDLSDVVGDFEATLKRSSESPRVREERRLRDRVKIDDGSTKTAPATPVHTVAQLDRRVSDLEDANVGCGNSSLSTGTLQNIREQMAVSLERMRELEEQVKAIPMLQVQLSVLKEEKRNLLRRVEELTKTNTSSKEEEIKEIKLDGKEVDVGEQTPRRYRSQSFSEEGDCLKRKPRRNGYGWYGGCYHLGGTPTRDAGTMCVVMTRDVGVSHQQVRTRDVGMLTSTPIKVCLERSRLCIEEILPDISDASTATISSDDFRDSWKQEPTSSELKIARRLGLSSLQTESIPSEDCTDRSDRNERDERSTRFLDKEEITRNCLKRLERTQFFFEDIPPTIVEKRSYGTATNLAMKDVLTREDVAVIVDDALRIYESSLVKKTFSRGTQCVPEEKKVVEKRDQRVQTSEQLQLRSNVGVTAKPRTCDFGADVRISVCKRTIAVGPDPISIRPLSLNSIKSRSHSFNYGDSKRKRKTTMSKSVGVSIHDLVGTAVKGTDTSGLAPYRREFGTSPIKKKYIDVSVGESVKPHISISCGTNYCDKCKETIKILAKQITNNVENNMNCQNSNLVSRIPRPSHISLNNSDHKKQFKRQDTYTKITATGIIRYDSDNKEQYDTSNRLKRLETEKENNDKSMLEDVRQDRPEKGIDNEEKHELPESALFQPIQENPRKKVEPSKEMQAAMKVLNDSFKKSPSRNISHQIKNATNIIQQEWFKISSTANANPLDVEDYLDCFEEYSGTLLEYVVNMTDSSGNTAMHYAVSHGNFDVVSILLDSKVCDINKANVAGYTAVMLAALAEVKSSTHASVANRLFQLADVNIRAKLHGQTALMLAVSHGRKDMTRLLLDAGAAVNIQDEDGSTALMCAAEHGHTDIVRMLLAHPDCDPAIVDIDGSSALKIALEAGNRDIGVLLYAHEHVNRGTSPYSSIRRSRRGSKPTTPTGPSPSAPVSPAPSRRMHASTVSLNATKYSAK